VARDGGRADDQNRAATPEVDMALEGSVKAASVVVLWSDIHQRRCWCCAWLARGHGANLRLWRFPNDGRRL